MITFKYSHSVFRIWWWLFGSECLFPIFLRSHETSGYWNNEARIFAQHQNKVILIAEIDFCYSVTHEKPSQPCQKRLKYVKQILHSYLKSFERVLGLVFLPLILYLTFKCLFWYGKSIPGLSLVKGLPSIWHLLSSSPFLWAKSFYYTIMSNKVHQTLREQMFDRTKLSFS